MHRWQVECDKTLELWRWQLQRQILGLAQSCWQARNLPTTRSQCHHEASMTAGLASQPAEQSWSIWRATLGKLGARQDNKAGNNRG